MTDEKKRAVAVVKGCSLVAKRRLGPETGPTRRFIDLGTMTKDRVYERFEKLLDSILLRAEQGDLPALKLMVELVALANKGREVSAATYQSVAEVLWTSYQEAQEVQGTETRE